MAEITSHLSTALADRYRIERHLGEGGMATVYLAHDVKHDRKVALKVLRPELAAVIGADRFLQEIKVTANLQHPHILPLHDSGTAGPQAGGTEFLFYVMPFIDGESLRDKLNREKQLAIDEAIEIIRSVSAALDYAHRQGVVHRDIKPENILLNDGQALVADFGIALAVSEASGQRLTETGLSIGTPHYMSPEQAMGDRELDARSDVYSLGAMLYEMLAGDPPYQGSTAQAIVAKVITEKAPPVTTHRDTVPSHVSAVIAKALSKLPADRFTSAARFAEALSDTSFATAVPATSIAAAESAAPVDRSRRLLWPAIAAVVTVVALIGWFKPGPAPVIYRYGLSLPDDQAMIDGFQPSLALAPDASWLVYVGPADAGGSQLWVKQRDQYEATPLAGTSGAAAPIVSPDGDWVVFIAAGELRKVPAGGGSAITLTDSVQMAVRAAAWLDDGTIVFTATGWRLKQVPDVGGPSTEVYRDTGSFAAMQPSPLPGGRGALFKLCDQGCRSVRELWVLDLRSGEARSLLPDVAQAWYASSGHLVYVRPDGGVFGVPFDLDALELSGAPVPVLEGVQTAAGIMPDFALSTSGTLVYVAGAAGGSGAAMEAVWVERDGTTTIVDPEWPIDLMIGNVGWALSPDGSRLAITLSGDDGNDIWIKELDDGPLSRLTFDPGQDERPRWSPDGQTVLFISNRAGVDQYDLYARAADGTGSAVLLLDLDDPIWEGQWSPDETWLVVRTGGTAGQVGERSILAMRPSTDSVPVPMVDSELDEKAAQLSPDGAWLAYESRETGRNEIYVRPFPNTADGKWQVSTAGGQAPLWSHTGQELFYREGRQMMSAQVETTSSFTVRERRAMFDIPATYSLSGNYTVFDIDSDDERFMMVRVATGGDDVQAGALIVVENWLEEVKEKVGN